MKKSLLVAVAVCSTFFGFAISAVDFTATDCSSNSHNLYTELSAGKVVVITWVMPCNACISVASTVANTVQGMGNPNVVFYLVDDYGNTTCSTLTSWASTNSITTNATFGNSGNVIKMTDYGSTGMQKTVVISPSHLVCYNVIGAVSQTALQNAINNALTGVKEEAKTSLNMNLFPNPAVNNTKITYALTKSGSVTLDIVNELGQKVKSVSLGNQSAGKQEYQLSLESFSAGIYFIRLNAGEASETTKLTISK